jgi:ArsR family transcriptional regulator
MPILEREIERSTGFDVASMFKALGDPTRLRIFEFLRDQCCPVAIEETGDVRPIVGPTVGDVCCHVTGREGVSSAISFHLKELRHAGLIAVERRGKNLMYRVCPEAVERLVGYLGTPQQDGTVDCCR